MNSLVCHGRPRPGQFADAREMMDEIALPRKRREEIESTCRSMGMQPGDIRRCIDLAVQCAMQCLRPGIAFGTRMVHSSGRGGVRIVVGMKPAGYREPLFTTRRGRSGGIPDTRWDEPLVWTVDPDSKRPGISQSRLSEWRAMPN